MSNRNTRKDSNKGPLGKEQSSKGMKSQSGSGQNQDDKKQQPTSNDGWENMWSKPSQPKQSDKDANQQQQNKKVEIKKNTQQDLKMSKAQSQIYQNMDDAIVSVDESQQSSEPSFKKNHSEIQKNPSQRKDQNKDLIFAGFGGNGSQKSKGWEKKRPGRELTKTSWVENSGKEETLGDLENSVPFDQFANRNTTYSESLYNTSYDLKNLSKQQVQYAAKIEREINNADSKGNTHLAEERNQIQLRDNDNEEIKYSGVLRAPQLKNAKKFSGFKKPRKNLAKNFSNAYSGTQQKCETVILNPSRWDELRDQYQTLSAVTEPDWNGAFQKPHQQNSNPQYQKHPQQNYYQAKPNQQYSNYQSQGGYQNNQDYQGGSSYQNQNYKTRYPNNNQYQGSHQQSNFIQNQPPQQIYQQNHQISQGQNRSYQPQANQNFNQSTKPFTPTSAPAYNPQAMTAPQLGTTSYQKPLAEQRAPPQFDQSSGAPAGSGSMKISTSSFTPSMAQNSAPWKPPQSTPPPTAPVLQMSTNAPSFKLSAGSQAFTPSFNK